MPEQIECDHLGRMIYPGECTICSGADRKLKEQQAQAPRVFPAKYAGQCSECNLPIEVGQSISWSEGKPVVHEACSQ